MNSQTTQLCAARLGAGRRVALLVAVATCCYGAELGGWEGHDWNQWRQVTTWQKPELRTDQAGRRELAPLLGGDTSGANRIASVRSWEERRKELAAAIELILGAPSNLQPPAREVRALGEAAAFRVSRRQDLRARVSRVSCPSMEARRGPTLDRPGWRGLC